MKTLEQLLQDWGNSIDGKEPEKYIYDYMVEQVAAERERIKECIKAREIRVDPMFYLAYQDVYKIIDNL